jgi:hypothetical protein
MSREKTGAARHRCGAPTISSMRALEKVFGAE